MHFVSIFFVWTNKMLRDRLWTNGILIERVKKNKMRPDCF